MALQAAVGLGSHHYEQAIFRVQISIGRGAFAACSTLLTQPWYGAKKGMHGIPSRRRVARAFWPWRQLPPASANAELEFAPKQQCAEPNQVTPLAGL